MIEKELTAMKSIHLSLSELDENARERVIRWILGTFNVAPAITTTSIPTQSTELKSGYASLAELYNAAQPTTASEKALVAGYWLQICCGQEEFPSQAVNKELQNLGHALSNVTDAFNQLREKKPALAIQTKKSGKSQQSRKLYKLTQAGIDYVGELLK